MDFEDAHYIMQQHARRVVASKGIVSLRANSQVKKLKGNTWLRRKPIGGEAGEGEAGVEYKLKYFKTDILTFHPEYVEISPEGWFGTSTHQRLNEFMPRGFRVYGHTFRELNLKRPLGFIKTPQGTYPYSVPATFNYDGSPTIMGGLHDDAYTAALNLSDYIEEYLSRLFKRIPCDAHSKEGALRLFDADATDRGAVSKHLGRAIVRQSFYRHLLGVATLGDEDSLNGLTHADIVGMLTERGAEVFKRPSTKQEQARRLEDTLYFGQSVADISKTTLRSYLRRKLITRFVEMLGFDEVEWSRR